MNLLVALLVSTFFAIPRPQPRMQLPIETRARELLANFTAGRMAAATKDFNDALRPVVTPELLAEVKGQLDAQAGAFSIVTAVHQRRQDGMRAIELIARFEKLSVSVVVVFDPLDRVNAVYFNPIRTPGVDPALEKTARDVVSNMVAARYDEAVNPFDATMRAQLTPASLAVLVKNLEEPFGTFVAFSGVKQSVDGAHRVIELTLSYTKRSMAFRVSFDGEGRVAGLNVAPAAVP